MSFKVTQANGIEQFYSDLESAKAMSRGLGEIKVEFDNDSVLYLKCEHGIISYRGNSLLYDADVLVFSCRAAPIGSTMRDVLLNLRAELGLTCQGVITEFKKACPRPPINAKNLKAIEEGKVLFPMGILETFCEVFKLNYKAMYVLNKAERKERIAARREYKKVISARALKQALKESGVLN